MNRAWVGEHGSGSSGARPDEARRHNRAALLRRLHVDGPCTRAVLAAELGLNRSTIKAVVDGLAESGVVTEAVPARRTGAGRPSLMVLPQPESAVVLAVDVRVEQVAMSMVGLGGQVIGRHSWNLRRSTRTPGEVITHVAESAQLLAEELAVTPSGAGISVPGVVRRDDGWVHEAPNLELARHRARRPARLGAPAARAGGQRRRDGRAGRARAGHRPGRRRPRLHLGGQGRRRRRHLLGTAAARHPRLRRRARPPGRAARRAALLLRVARLLGDRGGGGGAVPRARDCPRTPRAASSSRSCGRWRRRRCPARSTSSRSGWPPGS